jgi:signal transduction histidine kinase
MKIRTRLTVYFTILVMAIVLAGGLITYISVYRYNEKIFYDRLQAKALTTAHRRLEVQEVDSALLANIDKYQHDLLPAENITVYDSADHDIYTNNDTIYYKEYKALFDNIREKHYIRYIEGPYKIIAFTYNANGNRYIISAGAIDQRGQEILKQLGVTLSIILLLSGLLAVVAGWFFVGKSLEPISTIISKVSSLSPVEHSERLPVLTEKDEIDALIRTFNDLFDKLEDSFGLQKNFVANVSHELNNPLTKIKSQIEVCLIQKRESESYELTMQSILEDVNELIGLIDDLLKFSRLTSDPFPAIVQVRIDELLFDVRDNVLAQFPNYHININIPNAPQSTDQFVISCNKQLITAAVKNVVENACKFSDDHTAYINLLIEDNSLSIAILDSGPGIPAKDMRNIFEPFYRSPNMEDVKGFGIGLALAQRILKAHKFGLKVDSSLGVGTNFTIHFSN